MAEPISLTASVIGIVASALHSVRLLADDLGKIKDAPKSIASLKERIGLIEGGFSTLKSIGDQEWDAIGVAEDTKATIKKCGETCKRFSKNIEYWTRHSDGDSLTLLDRSNLGFLKQKRLESMERELQHCQGAITQVVSIATLISSLRHTSLSKEIQEEKKREVSVAIRATETESAKLSLQKREIRVRGAEIESKDEEDEYDTVSRQVQEEQKSLELSQSLMKALLATLQEPAISQIATKMQVKQNKTVYNVNFGERNYGYQVGVNHGSINQSSIKGFRSTE
ncbi:hypothetical protein N7478_000621 [Penicillium angulare]|uniref:uncharacterized protein n=1 Tax=Penicillium angulare TaxID=116970 RepID=UPI0025413D60|nr:uncharacterized protein N7478_000621 [Penicillium angulare]KAJ5291370.1 hypothetical protein N7478_000621 [Penicillium angulare]